MKYALALLLSICISTMSCDKPSTQGDNGPLAGSWKMIEVTEIATNATETKPAAITGDVIIRLTPVSGSGGSFSGNTPSNVFGPNTYALSSGNDLIISNLNISEVVETSWGDHFVETIRNTSKIQLENASLLIQSPVKRLRFQRQ